MALSSGFAAQLPPSGEYAELHACEVYTGGCTASAQSTTGGRSILRAWQFAKGSVGEVPLEGLSLVVLEVAEANLAMPETKPTGAIAYLPRQATEKQRNALKKFLQNTGVVVTETKVVPMSFERKAGHLTVRAGDNIEFTTRELEKCDSGGCGEQLWYAPRGQIGSYTVLVDDHSRVEEPRFQLIWRDNATKSVFFGKFGGVEKSEFSLAVIP